MAEPVLSGDRLTKAFGGIAAVQDVDIAIGAGEVIGVLGPNGSGKTTLLSMLAGLVRPDGGRVHATGHDVTRAAPHNARRRQVAVTLQNPRVFASLTVREHLELALFARREGGSAAGGKIDDTLEVLGLQRLAQLRAGALSGGQRKLVDLARALVVRPRVLLADEPTAGVSHAGKELVTVALRTAAARDHTGVVVVSHDLPWTFDLCGRITFMRAGQVLVEGVSDQVRGDPAIANAYLR
jgi:branched-chain amino acid transport system ATP-binding protein